MSENPALSKPLIFNSTVVLASFVEHLGNLSIFGIACPYVAIVICLYLCSCVFQWRLIFANYLCRMSQNNQSQQAHHELHIATVGTFDVSLMRLSVSFSVVSTILFGLFTMEIAYDDSSVQKKYIVLTLVCCSVSTVSLYYIFFVTICFRTHK